MNLSIGRMFGNPIRFVTTKNSYPCDDIERYRDFRRVVKGVETYEKYDKMDIFRVPNDGNRFSLVDDDERKILSENLHKIILGEV